MGLSLLGLHPELDEAVSELAFSAMRYQDYHPAATGDVSLLLSDEAGKSLTKSFISTTTSWLALSKLEDLALIRNDGRSDYRGESPKSNQFYQLMHRLSGRVMLITRTGCQLPEIMYTLRQGKDGKLLCIVEVNDSGDAFRLLYGNAEFGSIPSIELHIHLSSAAIAVSQGWQSLATVHAHPYHLVRLGMEPQVSGRSEVYNALLYGLVEGINRIDDRRVAVIPYEPSGSSALVDATLPAMRQHNLLLWMNHGFTVRSSGIGRGYAVMSYAKQCAKAALDALRHGAMPLPEAHIAMQADIGILEQVL